MSYRTYVRTETGRTYQFLGNNVCSKIIIDELKRQGCKVDADNCFNDFELKDVQAFIEAIEEYIIDTYKYYKDIKRSSNIFDFSEDVMKLYENKNINLTQHLEYNLECYVMWASVNFLKHIKNSVVEVFDEEKGKFIYVIKEKCHVYVSAF